MTILAGIEDMCSFELTSHHSDHSCHVDVWSSWDMCYDYRGGHHITRDPILSNDNYSLPTDPEEGMSFRYLRSIRKALPMFLNPI